MTVKAWTEKVTIPTYGVGEPDKNPMFFEKRVYQGSSGVVYPNPVIEKIFDEKEDKEYTGVFLENKYLRIMILPELGGRVQMAYDKIKERHFIYYNHVIKPALVGLCGPWISGGIEFNWPQHHRPSTYEPIDHVIKENKDGSKTIWVNEIEKMFHTKGMAGFTLYPDKAYLEIKAQLFNSTNLPQTFLWWSNPAVKVNDHYQSVFPPDVNAVYDHGKRDVSSFPIATGTYYKVDYSPGTDISRYNNIPVPTSYMAVNSKYDFVGGYEHENRAGMLHIADHHLSPGKKQWTWGNGDFGTAWDRNLTDDDGPYIELMTGVFTDNQPDFSWIMPFEGKNFSQYFLPYRELGIVKNASKDLLLNVEIADNTISIQVFATSEQQIKIQLSIYGKLEFEESVKISPEHIYENKVGYAGKIDQQDISLSILDTFDKEVLNYQPDAAQEDDIPEPAKAAKLPQEIENNEQLFLTGHHLEQYRHATYSPVPYYEEALKRDKHDVRNNNALGLWYLRRGMFAESEPYFRQAVNTITGRNPNPYDGEPYYNLGLSLRYRCKTDEAYDAFFKAAWNGAWQDSAYYFIAQIDFLRGDYQLALEHINLSLDRNARNNKAYVLKMQALRKLGRVGEALDTASLALQADPFNLAALFESHLCYLELNKEQKAEDALTALLAKSRESSFNMMAYAIDYIAAGLYREAIELMLFSNTSHFSEPLINYYIAYCWHKTGDTEYAASYFINAAKADPAYCFPNRLEDIEVLETAIRLNPGDSKAPYYLGNLFYDKRQYEKAIVLWLESAGKNNKFPTVYRNLAISLFNKANDHKTALEYFEKAFSLDPLDARVLMELDQLYKRLNVLPGKRLQFLLENKSAAESRDDLYLEIASLYNFRGDYEKAHHLIMSRKFHPWEGGEGRVPAQYTFSLIEFAKTLIGAGEYKVAIDKLEQAQHYPENLGEGKLYGASENDIFYWLGCAYQGLKDTEHANHFWSKATVGSAELGAAMFYNDQQPDKIFYQGLGWKQLGETDRATQIFDNMVAYGNRHLNDEIKIDYFAVSLPNMLIFEDDLNHRNIIHCLYIVGLGYLGLQKMRESEEALKEVLQKDAMHFGAKSHLGLLKDWMSEEKSHSEEVS